MKFFLAHTMVFDVGCIWKNKSGWFQFVMSLGLSVATENCVDCWGPSLIFNPSLAQNQPYTMVFVGSILKIKSGWFQFVMSLGLSVATEIMTAGVHH
jgi:hypothetical protein